MQPQKKPPLWRGPLRDYSVTYFQSSLLCSFWINVSLNHRKGVALGEGFQKAVTDAPLLNCGRATGSRE